MCCIAKRPFGDLFPRGPRLGMVLTKCTTRVIQRRILFGGLCFSHVSFSTWADLNSLKRMQAFLAICLSYLKEYALNEGEEWQYLSISANSRQHVCI